MQNSNIKNVSSLVHHHVISVEAANVIGAHTYSVVVHVAFRDRHPVSGCGFYAVIGELVLNVHIVICKVHVCIVC